ncbi:hypothetical protein KI387_011039 [Taxus chinensis]|uniref:Uncharacterized protein n=1 Tax=Taxus chinensis TaxID=29808 RepID=A0AA38KX11_TAXCH|nr:hypothetical protein KI387_011039 [Taxus chinensis]
MAFAAFRPPGMPSTPFGGFGSTPAPSFQEQQQQQFQQQQQQQQFQQQQQQFQQQQQQQQQHASGQNQQHIHLFTNERTPVTFQTKWADIHPDSQKLLSQIEERILQYRHESQMLDQCGRLYDISALNEGFEHDAARILQLDFLLQEDQMNQSMQKANTQSLSRTLH